MIMIRSTKLLASLALVAAGLSASPSVGHAQAAQRKPSQKDIDAARKHFQLAEAAKARGEYQTAAVEYLAAYELFEEPAFFYDTSEVYRLAGDEKNALVYYTKYLELAPSGQGATASRLAADQLRRSIAAKEDAARRAAEDEARRSADEQAKAHQAPAAGIQASAADPSPPSAAGRSLRLAGLATAGAGVVGLGIGIVFGLKARSISNEASGWTTFDPQRDDQGKADERKMVVLTSIGGAAIVTGGVLYYLGHRARQPGDAGAITFAPHLGASAITLTATSRF